MLTAASERRALDAFRRQCRAEARVGLSNVHIGTPSLTFQRARGAPYVRVAKTGSNDPPKGGGGRRGCVNTFSRRSRRRLLERLAQVQTRSLQRSLFVTLTVPAEEDVSPGRIKAHLRAFLARLERVQPGLAVFWKLEFTQLCIPHLHLIVLNSRYLSHEWVGGAWADVVGSEHYAHRMAGTEVRRVKSWRRAMAYAAKYVAKQEAAPGGVLPGRWWGIVGAENLPVSMDTWHVDMLTYLDLLDDLRRLAGIGITVDDVRVAAPSLWLAVDALTGERLAWIAGGRDGPPPRRSAG